MDKRIDLFGLLRQEGKLEKIQVFPAVTRENDPTEHTKDTTFLNPVTIEALVRNVSTEALTWKYFGLIPTESKEIIVKKSHKKLLMLSRKIKIQEDYYKCYFDDQRGFGMIPRQDYLVVILERKLNA